MDSITFKIPYPSLEKTLQMLKAQTICSFPFARKFLPSDVITKMQIFNHLKKNIMYKSDPKDIELIQSMSTLFTENNQHGIYGAGDCDCFTVAALASLYVKGYRNLKIALAGYNKNIPSHIYVIVDNVAFDLTNKTFGKERNYPFKQYLKVRF